MIMSLPSRLFCAIAVVVVMTREVQGQDAPTRSPDFGSLFPPDYGGGTPSPGVPIPEPTLLPAPVPAEVPVPVPVVDTPAPVDVPVATPAPVEVPVATSAPVDVPVTLSPSTIAPVSVVPTTVVPVTVVPTTIVPVTVVPAATVPPTTAPVPAPTTAAPFQPVLVNELIRGIYLVYPNVSIDSLNNDNINEIAAIHEQWFVGVYKTIDIDMNTTMNITEHGAVPDDRYSTFIFYDQNVMFLADFEEDLTGNVSDYAIDPFSNEFFVRDYVELLQETFPEAFANVGSIAEPVQREGPIIPVTEPPTEAPNNRIKDEWIFAIILASIAFVCFIAFAVYTLNKRSAPKAYVSPYEPTPSAVLRDQTAADASKVKIPVEAGTFIVYAPTGKLGFSLDQPDAGPLVIFVVKDDSPLHDYIQPGDRLIGVDELDVRKSSPARVVGLLRDRSANPYRKLTLIRSDETTTVNDVEGQYVVYAPPEKLGFSLEKSIEDSANMAPTVRAVKPTSILANSVDTGDELIGIDEMDTRSMTAQESVNTLKARGQNPARKLTFVRIMTTAGDVAGESKYDEADPTSEGYVIAFAPAGPLGFALESPDASSMVVHSIKSTSPLVDQVKMGDKLIGVDDVDVRNLSPTRIVNLLATRKTNMWRKLTLVRRGATVSSLGDSTIQLDEGIIVVYVPATKLGFSLNSIDDGAPVFEIIKEDSLLADTARVGDRLLRIDEKDLSTTHAGKAVKLLNARKANPYRRLVIQRGGAGTVMASAVAAPTVRPVDGERYTVVAPAGKLGVILDNPDDGAPVIHTVKDTSPLLGMIAIGDRLVQIDNVDVSGFTPAQVVQLLSTKSNNPERLLTMLRPSPVTDTGSAEPEIVVGTDGESTVGGEYIEDTGDEATAATGGKEE